MPTIRQPTPSVNSSCTVCIYGSSDYGWACCSPDDVCLFIQHARSHLPNLPPAATGETWPAAPCKAGSALQVAISTSEGVTAIGAIKLPAATRCALAWCEARCATSSCRSGKSAMVDVPAAPSECCHTALRFSLSVYIKPYLSPCKPNWSLTSLRRCSAAAGLDPHPVPVQWWPARPRHTVY